MEEFVSFSDFTLSHVALPSGKFHEPDLNTPASRVDPQLLSECCEGSITPAAIRAQETMVLQRALKWKLDIVTVAQCLETVLALHADEEEGDAMWHARVGKVAGQLLRSVYQGILAAVSVFCGGRCLLYGVFQMNSSGTSFRRTMPRCAALRHGILSAA